ncbi:ABC transporter ATP-binding protein [Kurthia gibsonii]|uniref:ABC transporter ATP-binding protein n=1 Tax=Kurthia gibsonii TaxID=33946 RepID=UPI001141DCDF|nr:ABC transporter ATP-binding protein [Kurthia gibsonii]GED19789.1 multidrug ABC transporter permease [Kurthia gibsonii]
MTEKEKISKKNFKKFIQLVKSTNPPKLLIVIALILTLSTTAVSLMVPLFTKNLVNDFTIDDLNKTTIALLVGAIILQALSGGFSIYILNRIGQSVVAGMRDRLWKKLLVLPVNYFDENPSGETVSRMTNDTTVVKTLISEHLANFLSGIISIIGAMIVLFILDWRMTTAMFIAIPLAAAILIPLGRKMYKISKNTQLETSKFTALLTQVLSEIRLVKSSNSEKIEYNNGATGIRNLFNYGLKEAKVYAFIGPIINLVMMILLVVLLGYGGMRVSSGALSAGALVAFIMYLFQIIMPMAQIAEFFTQFQKASGATERIIEILEVEDEKDGYEEVKKVDEAIQIECLSYNYPDKEPVLKNLNFTIPPNQVTAIVGPSGSGKTTFFSLIERFYQPQKGAILLGNQNIQNFSLLSWRKQIGYVSQESPIIAGTIRDNITYGLEREVSDEEINRVIKMAYADQFIENLEDGILTEVGERGMKLSGGQRQRIAIARAFLRNPQILMLDEATSSLDSKSEQVVQRALEELMKGRTTIVIAHRLSTVIHSDQIVFLEQGEITGIGTHQELYATHALYKEFSDQQLKGLQV